MNWGVNNIKEGLEFAALLIGIISVGWAIYTFTISRKQFQHDVMISCIERFQSILSELKSPDNEVQKRAFDKYIDLCNEELFYFKQKYIPNEVAKEWLDGMLYLLPLYHTDGEVISKGPFFEFVTSETFKGYPRIRKTFRVCWLPDMGKPGDREKVIAQLLKYVKKISYTCS